MNLLGIIANTNNNDNTIIGLNSILIDRETIVGATMIPNKLIASIIPAAVDWICTENDSVCKQTIKVYPIANLSKILLKKTLLIPINPEDNKRVSEIIGTANRTPTKAVSPKKTEIPLVREIFCMLKSFYKQFLRKYANENI